MASNFFVLWSQTLEGWHLGSGLPTEFRIVKSLQVVIQLGFRETEPFFLTFTSVSGLLRFHPGSIKPRKNTIESPKCPRVSTAITLMSLHLSWAPYGPNAGTCMTSGPGCPGCLGRRHNAHHPRKHHCSVPLLGLARLLGL